MAAESLPAAPASLFAEDPELNTMGSVDQGANGGSGGFVGPLVIPEEHLFKHSSMGRAVVFVIVGTVGLGTLAAWFLAQFLYGDPSTLGSADFTVLGRSIELFRWRPSIALVAGALLTFLFIAVTAVISEQISALRRVPNGELHVRQAAHLIRRRQDSHPGSTHVTVLIPAHNEEASIAGTLTSLFGQSRLPERVIVVADNCTDNTVAIARRFGAEVFETVGNTRKKGGALNQALARYLPEMYWYDVVLVMDADTRLNHRFIESGADEFDDDAGLSAVGGIFHGEGGHGLLGQLQRNEYTRYGAQINRRRGRVFVLTGTASMFRADALALVASSRGTLIPGHAGDVYDTETLTEDNEITLALKRLGARMISPKDCTVETELMPTWKLLWTQRTRWQRGALENVSAYGFTTSTLRYWGQQIGIGYGAVALWTAYAIVTIWFLAIDELVLFPFWLAVTALYMIERVLTVWTGGWKARLLAVTLFIEVAYDMLLQLIFLKALWDILWGRTAKWYHVPPELLSEEAVV